MDGKQEINLEWPKDGNSEEEKRVTFFKKWKQMTGSLTKSLSKHFLKCVVLVMQRRCVKGAKK